MFNNDEIDLSPYINRALERKWIIIAVVVLFGIAGYLGSALLPVKYQVAGTLKFTGYRRIEGTDSSYLQLPIIMPASAISIVQQIANSEADELKGISGLLVTGEEFPLQISFQVNDGVDISTVSAFIISRLNSNDQVQTEVENQRTFLTGRLESTNTTIEEVADQLTSAKQAGFSCSAESAALGSAYADLAALKEELETTKAALQMELDSLTGFQYMATPYLENNGAPVSPKKVQNGAVAAFGAGVIALGVSAFVKTKEER